MSNMHHTTDYKQYCRVGNKAIDRKLDLNQAADVERNLDRLKVYIRTCICASLVVTHVSYMCSATPEGLQTVVELSENCSQNGIEHACVLLPLQRPDL